MDESTTLSEIATRNPAAARVFQRHRLDFCCEGRRSLADACAEHDLDPEDVLAEIREAPDPGETDWSGRPNHEIIEHILTAYHAPLREELPRLREMAQRVEEEHAAHPACPKGLAALLGRMILEVESHLMKEEEILFPIIRAGQGMMADGPVRMMELEHADHTANLARVRALTSDFSAPEDACATWSALCRRLEALELELMRHIHLENAVLFPKALAGAA